VLDRVAVRQGQRHTPRRWRRPSSGWSASSSVNEIADYPNGDEVRTVEPWAPPDLWANVSVAALNMAPNDIEAGMPNGQRYSAESPAKARAAWPAVQRHWTEPQCRKIICTRLTNGVLYVEEYDDPIGRKLRKGLRVNPAKRPG
jgi:hypothetical protein